MNTTSTPTTTSSHSIRISKSSYDDLFLFHDNRDPKFLYAFYANVPCIYYEPAYFYLRGIFSDTKNYGTVPFDQFDKFIKRLTILSVAIMDIVKSNTNNTERDFYIFQPKEEDHAVKIVRQNFNPKFITLSNQDKHEEVVGDSTIIPYTKQLNEYINQYFTALNKTMDQWLNLN